MLVFKIWASAILKKQLHNSLQLATMESNFNFNKELYNRPRKRLTLYNSQEQQYQTVSAINLGVTHPDIVGFTYKLQ
jgi:hypothetical protein